MPDAPEILQRIFSSEDRVELLILFRLNPRLVETRESLARRLGKGILEVNKDIDELISLGILGSKKIGLSELVFMNREGDLAVQKQLAEYIKTREVD